MQTGVFTDGDGDGGGVDRHVSYFSFLFSSFIFSVGGKGRFNPFHPLEKKNSYPLVMHLVAHKYTSSTLCSFSFSCSVITYIA